MDNSPSTLLETLSSFNTIATPILLSIFSIIGLAIKRKFESAQKLEERNRKLEEELRGDRLEVYNEVLRPFILLFSRKE